MKKTNMRLHLWIFSSILGVATCFALVITTSAEEMKIQDESKTELIVEDTTSTENQKEDLPSNQSTQEELMMSDSTLDEAPVIENKLEDPQPKESPEQEQPVAQSTQDESKTELIVEDTTTTENQEEDLAFKLSTPEDSSASDYSLIENSFDYWAHGTMVYFDTYGIDSASATYEWDFESDGEVDSTDPYPYHNFDTPGEYNVTLNVKTLEGMLIFQELVIIYPPLKMIVETQGTSNTYEENFEMVTLDKLSKAQLSLSNNQTVDWVLMNPESPEFIEINANTLDLNLGQLTINNEVYPALKDANSLYLQIKDGPEYLLEFRLEILDSSFTQSAECLIEGSQISLQTSEYPFENIEWRINSEVLDTEAYQTNLPLDFLSADIYTVQLTKTQTDVVSEFKQDITIENEEQKPHGQIDILETEDLGDSILVHMSANVTGSCLKYEWDFESDGIIDAYTKDITFEYTPNTDYSLSLKVANNKGEITLVETYKFIDQLALLNTPEPETTVEPEATPEPETIEEPEATPEPEATVDPETTPEPETTVDPEVTPEPETIEEPEVTPEPEATPEPETIEEPEVTPDPEATPETETTVDPEVTPDPEATPEPETTVDPETTPEPETQVAVNPVVEQKVVRSRRSRSRSSKYTPPIKKTHKKTEAQESQPKTASAADKITKSSTETQVQVEDIQKQETKSSPVVQQTEKLQQIPKVQKPKPKPVVKAVATTNQSRVNSAAQNKVTVASASNELKINSKVVSNPSVSESEMFAKAIKPAVKYVEPIKKQKTMVLASTNHKPNISQLLQASLLPKQNVLSKAKQDNLNQYLSSNSYSNLTISDQLELLEGMDINPKQKQLVSQFIYSPSLDFINQNTDIETSEHLIDTKLKEVLGINTLEQNNSYLDYRALYKTPLQADQALLLELALDQVFTGDKFVINGHVNHNVPLQANQVEFFIKKVDAENWQAIGSAQIDQNLNFSFHNSISFEAGRYLVMAQAEALDAAKLKSLVFNIEITNQPSQLNPVVTLQAPEIGNSLNFQIDNLNQDMVLTFNLQSVLYSSQAIVSSSQSQLNLTLDQAQNFKPGSTHKLTVYAESLEDPQYRSAVQVFEFKIDRQNNKNMYLLLISLPLVTGLILTRRTLTD